MSLMSPGTGRMPPNALSTFDAGPGLTMPKVGGMESESFVATRALGRLLTSLHWATRYSMMLCMLLYCTRVSLSARGHVSAVQGGVCEEDASGDMFGR